MEFDFDDIAGQTTTKKKKATIHQIGLNIPTGDTWEFKDITQCTAEEFIAWMYALGVVENDKPLDKKLYQRPDQRIRVMKQIESIFEERIFNNCKDIGVSKYEKLVH